MRKAESERLEIPPTERATLRRLGDLTARSAPAMGPDAIARALRTPIGAGNRRQPDPFEVVQPGESVCIVVSDQTRQTGMAAVLPLLLEGLRVRGCQPSDMFFLFATGIHRSPNPAEVADILGREIAHDFAGRIHMHDPDDASMLVDIGATARGVAVRVNRRAIEADRLILTGTAAYHYHAGFGGGRKALVPGLAARETIAWNHSLTLDPVSDRIHPGVQIGALDGNPVAEEMLEGARLCHPDIIINTVLAPDGSLCGLFCGDLDAAHRAACRQVEALYRADISEPADVVLASAAGAPDWVQSHKALFNAHRAIRPGGVVILLAPCPEGVGNERFRFWLRQPDIATLCRELRQRPEVNGQTALSTKRLGADSILVTGMNEQDSRDVGIETAPDLASAMHRARQRLGGNLHTCYTIPAAGHVVPFVSARSRSDGG